MSKILCVTSGLTGISNASLELISRLQGDGHEFSYAAPRKIGEKIEYLGIPFHELPQLTSGHEPPTPSFRGVLKRPRRFLHKAINYRKRQRQALESVSSYEFALLLKSKKVDLIICDMELHEYVLCAYQLDIPTVLLSQWFSIWPAENLPYIMTDTIPEGSSSRSKIKKDWAMIAKSRRNQFTKQKVRSLGTDRRSTLLRFAKKINFPQRYIGENYWPGPFLFDELPVLSMTAKELEFKHKTRSNLTYVGPMVFEGRDNEKFSSTIVAKLDSIIHSAEAGGSSLVYCSISTLHKGDQSFIQKVIGAAKEMKKYTFVVSLGGHGNIEDFSEIPSNVFLFSKLPQLMLLKHADCSINHGGIHTINECIHFKVPMLVYSGQKSDQNGCAARVHHHGIGIMANKDLDEVAEIRSNIIEIITNSQYKEKIVSLNKSCKKYKEDKIIENIIRNLLESSTKKKIMNIHD